MTSSIFKFVIGVALVIDLLISYAIFGTLLSFVSVEWADIVITLWAGYIAVTLLPVPTLWKIAGRFPR